MRKNAFLCVMALLLVISVIAGTVLGKPAPISAEAVQNAEVPPKISSLDFSLRLLRECASEGKNVLLSPLCAASALTAVSLGSAGNTREQLENVLVSSGDLDALAASLGSTISDCDAAVSLWVNNDGRLALSEDYSASVKDALDAEVSFTDFGSAIDKMNSWVQDVTDGRITSIFDNIPPNAVMYILSAIAFNGEWTVPYASESVTDGIFTSSDGTAYEADFMKSTESIFIEAPFATGFAKPYTNGSYFVALLPSEGVSIADMLSYLDGNSFEQIMSNSQSKSVSVYIPKFTAESSLSLSDTLVGMGAVDAFSRDSANFSVMGSDSLYISDFMQNTYLSVDEVGTQGGAAAGAEVSLKGMPGLSVNLNRPFAYFIVKDKELLFSGILEKL